MFVKGLLFVLLAPTLAGAAAASPATSVTLATSATAAAAPASEWERLADGSMGQETVYHGVDGLAIPAYVRKPDGPGPFPVVVLAHGGVYSKGATMGLGRSQQSPTEDFIKAGWAIYSIDYRLQEKVGIYPIEVDDTVEAVKAVRKLPFIDPQRVGYMGGSHGAQLGTRVVSRVYLSGAILCAPAAMDLIEVKKAFGRGEQLVSILQKLVKDMEAKYGATAEEIEKDPAKYGYSSGLTEASQVWRPILIVNGMNDNNSPPSIIEVYVKKLRAAGKQVETYMPENGPHGFYFGRPDIPEWKESSRRSVAFLQKQFAAQGAAKSASPAVKTSGVPADPPASGPASPAAAAADPPTSGSAMTPAGAAVTSTGANRPPIGMTKGGKGSPGQKGGNVLYGPNDWVDPDHSDAEEGLVKSKTFHSATINGDVSYMIYFPPEYDKDTTKRYPVLYNLHASGGTPRRDSAGIFKLMDPAIRAGKVDPMIIVFPNGLAGNTMYSDSKDGKYPVESVIVKDLVPHVDATYRTIASRVGRALNGFSMGGFGAAHFGFKYPDMFGVVSIMAPPLLEPGLTGLPANAWSRLFPMAMGSDMDYFRENNPFDLVVKNADKLRDRSYIRIVCHSENENWLAPQCEKLHEIMMKQMIGHQFDFLANVKSHNPNGCFSTLGDAGIIWFSCGFRFLQSHPEGMQIEPGQGAAGGMKGMKKGPKQAAPDGGTQGPRQAP